MIDNNTQHPNSSGVAARTGILLLAIYYLYTVASLILVEFIPNSPATLPFSLLYLRDVVYQLTLAQSEGRAMPSWWIESVRVFHKHDPSLISALITYETKQKQGPAAKRDVNLLLKLDPKNIDTYRLYVSTMKTFSQTTTVVMLMTILTRGYMNQNVIQKESRYIWEYPPDTDQDEEIGNALDVSKLDDNKISSILAYVYYMIGIRMAKTSADGASQWLELASLADSSLSYYVVEEANLLQLLGREEEARSVLFLCAKNNYTKKHCETALKQISKGITFSVGDFKDEIYRRL